MAASKDLGVGQDPVLIKQIVDVISPTLYPSGFAAWDFGIGDPGRNPHDTVLAALIQWRSILVNGQAELRPLLQAYSTPAGAYGKTEIDAQIRAAHEAGANGYVLSNPDGKY